MTTKVQPMAALLTALGVVACNDTQAPNPPFQLVISGGNGQNWYFKNPLPTPLSVTALDVDGSPVSGVVVTWAVTSGSGSGDVNPKQSTTNANGIATTIDSIGTSTLERQRDLHGPGGAGQLHGDGHDAADVGGRRCERQLLRQGE